MRGAAALLMWHLELTPEKLLKLLSSFNPPSTMLGPSQGPEIPFEDWGPCYFSPLCFAAYKCPMLTALNIFY